MAFDKGYYYPNKNRPVNPRKAGNIKVSAFGNGAVRAYPHKPSHGSARVAGGIKPMLAYRLMRQSVQHRAAEVSCNLGSGLSSEAASANIKETLFPGIRLSAW